MRYGKDRLWYNLSLLLQMVMIGTVVVFLCLLAYRHDNKYTAPGPRGKNGLLVLSEEILQDDSFVYLLDGWEFYRYRQLTPADFAFTSPQPDAFVFIGQYGGFDMNQSGASPHGEASYRLRIELPPEERSYLLELPEIFSAYRLYIDGSLVAGLGQIGSADYQPLIGNRTYLMQATDSLELLLVVSDYSHLYSGLVYPPAFGEPQAVQQLLQNRLLLRASICAVVLVIGILSALVSLWGRKNIFAAYYGLLCLLFLIYSAYPLSHTFFSLGPWLQAMEMAAFCCMLWLVALLQARLCAIPARWQYPVFGCGLIVFLIAILSPWWLSWGDSGLMHGFSRAVTLYEWLTAAFLTFSAGWALRHGQTRARVLLSGLLAFDMTLIMDRLLPLYEPILTAWFPELGSLAIVLTIGIVIAQDVAEQYRQHAMLEEHARSMEKLYTTHRNYYHVLQQELQETKRLRHDMRHHFTLIHGLIQNHAYEELNSYLAQYGVALQEAEPLSYSHNTVVNVLLFHYNALCRQQGIEFGVRIGFQGGIDISDVELCSVLSNLLENAFEACLPLAAEEGRFIKVGLMRHGDEVLLRVDNSSEPPLQTMQEGLFLSSKDAERRGYGLASVRTLVEKNGGYCFFEWEREKRLFSSLITLKASEVGNGQGFRRRERE